MRLHETSHQQKEENTLSNALTLLGRTVPGFLAALMQKVTGARLSVLIFHRVLADADAINPTTPDAAVFEELMRHMARQFQVVPLSAAMCLEDLPARAVAITFDDGYADNAIVAAPILRRLGLPATFFIATGFLNGGRMWNDTIIETVRAWKTDQMDLSDLGLGLHPLATVGQRVAAIESVIDQTKYLDWKKRNEVVNELSHRLQHPLPTDLMMTSAQVRELVAQGMDVGGHTVTHPILLKVTDASAEQEIVQGKRELEAIAGIPIKLFAYPNGKPGIDYNARHVEMVKRAGFTGAVSTAIGSPTRRMDPFQIPRFTPWSTVPERFGLQLAQNFLRTRYETA
jgi:peptidoglycan/xylan/chitin deacetylase (PgdA/CDA1 family)